MVPPKSPPSFKNNTSFVHRLSIRRTRHSLKSPVLEHLRTKLRVEAETSLDEGRQSRKNSEPFSRRFSDDDDECLAALPFLLTHKHKEQDSLLVISNILSSGINL